MTEKMSPDFLNELFRTCLKNKTILQIAIQHLEYHFLPSEEYKEIWKAIITHYHSFEDTCSLGTLAETFKNQSNVLQQIVKIKQADLPNADSILVQFEAFIKKAMFIELHRDTKDFYEKNNYEKAFSILQEKAEKIANFSLVAKSYEAIFEGFEDRYRQRVIESVNQHALKQKACWGIDALDNRHYGGVDKGDTALIVARSNVGKSPLLKWIGYNNARRGKKVLHIQVEGSKKECEVSYDSIMAASSIHDMELSNLPQETIEKLLEQTKKVSGEIHIVAYEKFGSVTMVDIKNSIDEYLKAYGDLDVLIIDYIDKVEPGNGKKYGTGTDGEKARRAALVDIFKNLAITYNVSGFTATQTSEISVEVWNNPKKLITRSDIKGDKNFIDPFSYVVTLNQTQDEIKNEVMRLYEEKCRKYGRNHTHRICTAYKYSRFYDRRRTLTMFHE